MTLRTKSQDLTKEVVILVVFIKPVCDWFCPPLGHRCNHDNTGVGPLGDQEGPPAGPQTSTLAKIHLCHLHMAFLYFLDPFAWKVCRQMFRILNIIWGCRQRAIGVPEFGGNGWEERMDDADTSSTSPTSSTLRHSFSLPSGHSHQVLLRENTFFFAKMFEKIKIEDIKYL